MINNTNLFRIDIERGVCEFFAEGIYYKTIIILNLNWFLFVHWNITQQQENNNGIMFII